jgi:hypothetical protein
MAWSNIEQVLLHEAIHEISIQRDAKLNEKQVRSMSEGLYEFLKTNNIVFTHKHDKDCKISDKRLGLKKKKKRRSIKRRSHAKDRHRPKWQAPRY